MSCASEKLNGKKRDVSACRDVARAIFEVKTKKKKKKQKGVIKMFRCSFMNYYCVRRLFEMGYSYYDFVECYADCDGVIHMFPIGCTWNSMMAFGDDVSMVFLGYSRRRFVL